MNNIHNMSQDRVLPSEGQMVNGEVLKLIEGKIILDLGNHMLGLIEGLHIKADGFSAKNIKKGDKISAMTIEKENEDGFIVLSLRKAMQENAWEILKETFENSEVIEVIPVSANRGGLILNYNGISGFIPVSQLSPKNYPRVDSSNASEILEKLNKFIGQKMKVKCIGIDEEARTIIVSEREAYAEETKEELKNIEIGQKVKAKIVGIVNFGFFVVFNGLEGLIHISEISWNHVKNPMIHGNVGDEISAIVTSIDHEKITLSIKQLTKDPWDDIVSKLALNQIVKGVVKNIGTGAVYLDIGSDVVVVIVKNEENKIINDAKIGDKIEARINEISQEKRKVMLSMNLDEKSEKKEIKADKNEANDEKKKTDYAQVKDFLLKNKLNINDLQENKSRIFLFAGKMIKDGDNEEKEEEELFLTLFDLYKKYDDYKSIGEPSLESYKQSVDFFSSYYENYMEGKLNRGKFTSKGIVKFFNNGGKKKDLEILAKEKLG